MAASHWGCSMYETPSHIGCWTLGQHHCICHRNWCEKTPISRSHQLWVHPGILPAGVETDRSSFSQTSAGSTLAGWRVRDVVMDWEDNAHKSQWNMEQMRFALTFFEVARSMPLLLSRNRINPTHCGLVVWVHGRLPPNQPSKIEPLYPCSICIGHMPFWGRWLVKSHPPAAPVNLNYGNLTRQVQFKFIVVQGNLRVIIRTQPKNFANRRQPPESGMPVQEWTTWLF